MIRTRKALVAACLLLSASTSRRLTPDEREDLERFCFIVSEGIPDLPISSYALRDFADKVRQTGLIEHGHAADVSDLLKHAESLTLLFP